MKPNLTSDLIKARKALGLNGESQGELLRKAREVYGLSNDELAQALGVSLNTLLAYLAPEPKPGKESKSKYRAMPAADKLILCRALEGRKRRK